MKGCFIVIEGVDGSGKGTQTRQLVKRLKKEGYDVLEADFPRYGQKSALMVEEYLNGRLGTIDEINAYQASTLYAIDRFCAAKELQDHLNKGGIIISNRYTTANLVHQATKIIDTKELDVFLEWIEDLEYNKLKIPRPDKVIFLNMHYLIGQSLVSKKGLRKYLAQDTTHDLHESDKNHLKKAYEQACSLVKRYDEWEEILCFEGDRPKSIEEIHEQVYNLAIKTVQETNE